AHAKPPDFITKLADVIGSDVVRTPGPSKVLPVDVGQKNINRVGRMKLNVVFCDLVLFAVAENPMTVKRQEACDPDALMHSDLRAGHLARRAAQVDDPVERSPIKQDAICPKLHPTWK